MQTRSIALTALAVCLAAASAGGQQSFTTTHEGLELTLLPLRNVYAPGEPLQLQVIYKNVSKQPVAIANPDYGWDIQVGDWKAQPTVDAAQAERVIVLQPGQSHTAEMMDLGYVWIKGGPVNKTLPEGYAHPTKVTVKLHQPGNLPKGIEKDQVWTGPVKLGPVGIGVFDEAKLSAGPLVGQIIARQQTYLLSEELADKDAAETIKKQAQDGRTELSVPKTDLVFRMYNVSDKAHSINIGGDASQMKLRLVGPGAVNVEFMVMMTMEFRMGKDVTIKPGEYHDIPIESLHHGKRGISAGSFWTQPGSYALEATYSTPVDGNARKNISAAPVLLHVQKPETELPALQACLEVRQLEYELTKELAGRGVVGLKPDQRGGVRNLPAVPSVEMVLHIKNTSDQAITLNKGGDQSRLELQLVGPGAVTLDNLPVMMTREFRMGQDVKLQPGESMDLPVEGLSFGMRNLTGRCYWTQAGVHYLVASYTTPVNGGSTWTITAPAAAIRVVEPE